MSPYLFQLLVSISFWFLVTPVNPFASRLFNLFTWPSTPDITERITLRSVNIDLKAVQDHIQYLEHDLVSRKELEEIMHLLSKPIKVCPLNRGAVKIGDSCYEYFAGKETFPVARQICRAFGGDLASIDLTSPFLHHIRYFYPTLAIDGTHHETWLGATRIKHTYDFRFFSGQIIHRTNARWNNKHFDFPTREDHGFPPVDAHGFPTVDEHGFPSLDKHGLPNDFAPVERHNCLILDDVDLVQDMIIDDCNCYNKRAFLCQYEHVALC